MSHRAEVIVPSLEQPLGAYRPRPSSELPDLGARPRQAMLELLALASLLKADPAGAS